MKTNEPDSCHNIWIKYLISNLVILWVPRKKTSYRIFSCTYKLGACRNLVGPLWAFNLTELILKNPERVENLQKQSRIESKNFSLSCHVTAHHGALQERRWMPELLEGGLLRGRRGSLSGRPWSSSLSLPSPHSLSIKFQKFK